MSQEEILLKLLEAIRKGNSLLFVGSGSSRIVDYPTLYDLVELLRIEFTPTRNKYNQNNNTILDYIDKIRNIIPENQSNKYVEFLREKFKPNGKIDNFHLTLISIPFKGIVTTNYDNVLETAINELRRREDGLFSPCATVDLCHEGQYNTLNFLRKTSENGLNRESILHLHGYFDEPNDIVLSKQDYIRRYRTPVADTRGKILKYTEDTHHQRVIFSLATSYSLVFVGFSMNDEFLKSLFEFVRNSFQRGYPIHFALMPFKRKVGMNRSEELAQKRQEKDRLEMWGVLPIFFDVPSGSDDYTALKNLVNDISTSTGIPPTVSSLVKMTKDFSDGEGIE